MPLAALNRDFSGELEKSIPVGLYRVSPKTMEFKQERQQLNIAATALKIIVFPNDFLIKLMK
jgi:hypothetical protein